MKRWIALAGGVFSIVLILFIVRQVDLTEVCKNIRHMGWSSYLLGASIYLTSFIPRGWRWRMMLPDSSRLSFNGVTRSLVIGYAANNLLPFRLGEVVRSFVVADRFKLSKVTCLGTIAAEKILDGCCLLGLLAISLPFVKVQGELSGAFHQMFGLSIGVFGAAWGGCCLLAFFDSQILRLVQRICPRSVHLVQSCINAVSVFKRGRVLLWTTVLTVIIWLIEGTCFVFFLSQLGVEQAWPKGLFCLVIVNLSILVPCAPGYVGVFQAGTVAAFLAMGLSSAEGLTVGVVTHAAQFVPTTLFGLFFASLMGLSWGKLYRLKN